MNWKLWIFQKTMYFKEYFVHERSWCLTLSVTGPKSYSRLYRSSTVLRYLSVKVLKRKRLTMQLLPTPAPPRITNRIRSWSLMLKSASYSATYEQEMLQYYIDDCTLKVPANTTVMTVQSDIWKHRIFSVEWIKRLIHILWSSPVQVNVNFGQHGIAVTSRNHYCCHLYLSVSN
jgi:hypothetical protein